MVANTLVDNNANGMLGHIEDAPGLSMIVLERHALLDGTISLNVNDVSPLVHFHIRGQMSHSLLFELTGEHVARSAPISLGVCHFAVLCVTLSYWFCLPCRSSSALGLRER